MYKYITYLFFFCLIGFNACTGGDAKAEAIKAEDVLPGEWTLYQGLRNGKVASTLEGAYFIFGQDNTLKTNLQGEEASIPYELSSNMITTKGGGPMQAEYAITYLTTDSLEMTTKLMGHDFVLKLVKGTPSKEM